MLKIIKQITKWQIVFIIQLIATIVLAFYIIKLGALPTLYLAILLVVLLLLLVGLTLMMRPSKKKKKGKVRQYFGKILSLLLSIVMVVGTIYIAQGDSTLSEITGADEQVNTFSLIVLNDSQYQKISDLSGKTVGMCKLLDKEAHITEAHNALVNEYSQLDFTYITDYNTLADKLYSKDIDAIYVNEAYIGMVEEKHPNLNNEVRSLWTYEITEQIVDISKDVNVTKDVFTIFISGIDTRGKVSTVSRSDVNMLVTVNPITKDILMTSIPRDCYITLDNMGRKDKLTHAGLGGVENSVKSLENFLDIDINYYARVNFTSLIKIVNALGGIDVYSPVAFTNTNGDLHVKKGTNHFNGEEALKFVRERYALGGGDGDRVANQQRVLKAMLNKAMSPSIIKNYSKLLKSINGSFETNMESSDITNLIQMQLSDMASWKFHSTTISGSGKIMTGGAYMPSDKLYYLIPNEDSVQKCTDLIRKMTKGQSIETN